MLLASLLRIFQITKRDFWYDEAFTGITIRDSFSGMMKIIINDVHPPLYYILVKYFSAPFNYNILGIRLFSAIFGVLCLAAIYFFTKELFNKKTALWASFLSAICPFTIQYSQEARMYTLFCFLIILACYFFIKALKTNRTSFFIFWGISLGLAALIHYMSLVFSVLFYFVFIIWNFKPVETKISKKFFMSFIKNLIPRARLILGYFFALLVFSPWLSIFLKNFRNADLDWIKPVGLSDIFYNLQMFIFGIPPGEMSAGMPSVNNLKGIFPGTVLIVLTILITSITIYLLFYKKKVKETLIVLSFSIGFMFLAYLISLAGEQLFVSRYLLPATYFFFVFISIWLANIKFRYAFLVAAFYIFLLSFLMVKVEVSQGWGELMKNIKKYDNNIFYSLNSFDYVIAKYYLGEERLILYNVDWSQYNPSFWAAIGPNLKRTENYADIKNDPNGLILYNTQAKKENRSDKKFNSDGLTLVDKYKNVSIYKF